MNPPTQQKPMRTVWHSLLWKEWHEHKWKLVGWLLLLVAISLLSYSAGGEGQNLPIAVSVILFLYSVVAGMFTGMYTAGGENGRGTMPFLQTLPVTMQKPAAVKLLMSLVATSVPVIAVIGLAYAYLAWHPMDEAWLLDQQGFLASGGRFSSWGFQHWLLGLGLSSILCIASLLLWMAAAGVNRPDEIRAGGAGFLTMAGVGLGMTLLGYWAEKWELPGREYGVLMVAAAPGGLTVARDHMEKWGSSLPFIISAVVGHACLLAWYLSRFGHKAVRPARTLGKRVKATKSDWLAPPRRSQLTAIIWKQVHETGPLALMAGAAILIITFLILWLNPSPHVRESRGGVLASLTFGVGFLVTVVAGQGVFLEDLKPKVGLFWRSRPVNTTLWFFVKFFTGLTVLVVTFGALFLLAFAFEDGKQLLIQDHAGTQVTFIALFFLLIYTLSMASYCLGRQPIISVVATLGILFCGVQVLGIVFEKSDLYWSVGLAALLIAQVAATMLAWLAVRNNWGWHR